MAAILKTGQNMQSILIFFTGNMWKDESPEQNDTTREHSGGY